MMRITAFILARSGSKGLPGKNIRPLQGKPLICWSIEAAKSCNDIDEVIVSTDGEEISEVAYASGAKVMIRPEALANDTAMPKDALRYHLHEMSEQGNLPDITILLQPTSPLRTTKNIQDCIDKIVKDGYDSVATFVKSPFSPYRAWKVCDAGGFIPFVEGFDPWQPRQTLPETFNLNGAVYAAKTGIFLDDTSHSFLPGKSSMVIMSSVQSVDIDTELDFKIAESILKSN
jgi:CMP-N,N'-diacetyllegionaminic acid synthase